MVRNRIIRTSFVPYPVFEWFIRGLPGGTFSGRGFAGHRGAGVHAFTPLKGPPGSRRPARR